MVMTYSILHICSQQHQQVQSSVSILSGLPSFYSLSAAFLRDSPHPYPAPASSETCSRYRKKALDQGKVSDDAHGYGLWRLQVAENLRLPPPGTLFYSACFKVLTGPLKERERIL